MSELTLVRQKHKQLDALLPTLQADAWLIYARERSDPATALFAGFEVIGESAFIFTKAGEKLAIVADYDRYDALELEVYDEVISYSGSFAEQLAAVVRSLKLRTFALNISQDDPLVDGLSCGLFERLATILAIPNLRERVVSAQHLLEPLRARKCAEELRRIRTAVAITERIFEELTGYLRPYMTERQVLAFIQDRQRQYGAHAAFGKGALVLAGRHGIGHRRASDKPIAAGDTLIIDMGCVYEGYTSDLQRTFYLLEPGETDAPAEVKRRFAVAQEAMNKALAVMVPGVRGFEVDKVARHHLECHGLPAYPHALGHQIGRSIHDGGTLLAPIGPRYGKRGKAALHVGEVYTVEPIIHGTTGVDGHPVGIEENVVITEQGAALISTPQSGLLLIS
jgi:Xaa-Pro aminopeptidase